MSLLKPFKQEPVSQFQQQAQKFADATRREQDLVDLQLSKQKAVETADHRYLSPKAQALPLPKTFILTIDSSDQTEDKRIIIGEEKYYANNHPSFNGNPTGMIYMGASADEGEDEMEEFLCELEHNTIEFSHAMIQVRPSASATSPANAQAMLQQSWTFFEKGFQQALRTDKLNVGKLDVNPMYNNTLVAQFPLLGFFSTMHRKKSIVIDRFMPQVIMDITFTVKAIRPGIQ